MRSHLHAFDHYRGADTPGRPPAGSWFQAYLLFKGGLDVPQYLNSRSTSPWLLWRSRRALSRCGDVLHLRPDTVTQPTRRTVAKAAPATYREWCLRVLYGLTARRISSRRGH